MRIALGLFVLGIALFACAARSRADAVMPPRTDCPSGTVGVSTHYGSHCAPARCEREDQCGSGRGCETAALCIESSTREHFRGNTTIETVVGPCGEGDRCARGRCERRRFCVQRGGCSIAPPSRAPSLLPWVSLMVLGLVRVRRSR